MNIKTYKNIGIIGKRFSGKTTFINHILDKLSPKKYFYFTRSDEKSERESLIFEIYNLKEVLDNRKTEKVIILDDVIYRKEILRFNKKTWDNFFIDQRNTSIVSTCNPSCFVSKPFDVIFLKTSKNTLPDNDYLYENYAKDICTLAEFTKVVQNDTVAIDYLNGVVYPYYIDDDRYRKLFDF